MRGRDRTHNNIRPCHCDACNLFYQDGYSPGSAQYIRRGRFTIRSAFDVFYPGHCDLCGREDYQLIRFLPQIIMQFFKTKNICWPCRNSINFVFRHEHNLCWSTASDDEIKWALAAWVLDKFKHHFSWAGGLHRDFRPRECCDNEAGHVRKHTRGV